MTTATRSRWREVRSPCPVCRHRGWCRVSPDGAYVACRREDQGAIRSLQYRDGAAWLHRIDGQQRREAPALPSSRTRGERAADADLDRVYRAVLSHPHLYLRAQHREQFKRRGLVEANVARTGYRSLPASCRADVGRALRERFADQLLLTVPGIIGRQGPRGPYLTLAGLPGLIIPIRSAVGHIVGLVIRPDEPRNGGKYRWISSAPYGGAGPGARVHVPAGVIQSDRVVLTEGALKADVAHALSGRAVVGMPGPHVTEEAIETLRAVGAVEVLLALDADTATNHHVARAQYDGLRRVAAAGFREGLLRWDPALGKGLDDALLSWKGAT